MDGALVPLETAALRADDSAFASGLGCYTTARIRDGAPRFAGRHAARLARDARLLGLGRVEEPLALRALHETADAVFPTSGGIVRLQASQDGDGVLHLTAVPRALGDEPDCWRVTKAPFPHEGRQPWGGVKVSNHLLYALASRYARGQDAEEALLFDREGYLVEGARSNVIVVGADGRPAVPDLGRGGVAGIAREILLEQVPEIVVRNIPETHVRAAAELVAVNAVRGARACIVLDGAPIGAGAAGEWARRLDACLAAA